MPWKLEKANAEPVVWQPDGGRGGHSMVSDEKSTVNLIYDESFFSCCFHILLTFQHFYYDYLDVYLYIYFT